MLGQMQLGSCVNIACRAKISMRLSSKNSEGSGLRKISSLKTGVSSPDGGVGSPFQPASQKPAPPTGPSSPPVSLHAHLLCTVVSAQTRHGTVLPHLSCGTPCSTLLCVIFMLCWLTSTCDVRLQT